MVGRHARSCTDRIIVDDWHVVADAAALSAVPLRTRLLGVALVVARDDGDGVRVARADTGEIVTSCERYGFVWACLGIPARAIVAIPEALDDERWLVTGGSIAVKVSGLRAVENFLDLGHLPFVHTGWLGEEPHTEIQPYTVEITEEGEVLATDVRVYQPLASPTATGGMMVDYVYRIVRPYTVALYKSNPARPDRMDAIFLFVQPVDEDNCVAHPLLCYMKDGMDEYRVRWFMQLIFSQDKPILENQVPRRLPLDPRAETPIRADASSIVYRRWLRDLSVTYGAIPASG